MKARDSIGGTEIEHPFVGVPKMECRRLSRWYGFISTELYKPDVHGSDAEIHEADGRTYARTVKVVAARNDLVEVESPVVESFPVRRSQVCPDTTHC